MDGSDGSTDLRMSIPENSACFVRTTAKQDGSLLLLGEPLPLLKLSSLFVQRHSPNCTPCLEPDDAKGCGYSSAGLIRQLTQVMLY